LNGGLTLITEDNLNPFLEIQGSNKKYRWTLTNDVLQLDYREGTAYKNTPISITGSEDNGIISTDSHYNLKFKGKGIGFFDSNGYAQQAAPANATDLASAISSLNSLLTKLKNYGLLK
jgi:hypothetical protein